MHIVLLDRDGTVIVDPPDKRVDSVDKIALLPGAVGALRYLARHDFGVVFVTNQAGIAEGRMTPDEFQVIHARVLELLAPSGVHFLQTYICPHADIDNCNCRKPKPALILRALQEFQLEAKTTYFIGDRMSDVAAGSRAGVQTVLVGTPDNNGGDRFPGANPTFTASNLLEAVRYVVTHS